MYIYPSNLKAKASLLFWTLRDVLIVVVLALLGIFALSRTQSPVSLVYYNVITEWSTAASRAPLRLTPKLQ